MGTTGVIGSFIVITFALRAPSLVCWFAGLIGALFAATVGFSRVYLGAHYPRPAVVGKFMSPAERAHRFGLPIVSVRSSVSFHRAARGVMLARDVSIINAWS
jgi:hypothetical protein